MSNHTPGPWTFGTTRKDSNFSKTLVGIVTTPYGNVARTYPVATSRRDEVEANAHLIAAAPDLLAALKLVTHLHELILGEDAWKYIHAAIAKAEAA